LRTMRRFVSSREGNVAIIFGLAIIPLVAFVGAAVDYSRANGAKVALQSALDSTALMISKEAATDTPTQLQTNAGNYFTALFGPDQTKYGATNATINISYTTSGGTQVDMSASTDVPTTFLPVIGIQKLTVSTSNVIRWGSSRLRVALVLDNTGSMSQSGKITALKTATNNLLTQLQNAATTNGDVYVSIIPFVKDVNLDPSEYNSNWIYWGTTTGAAPQDPNATDNNSWDANNGTCSVGGYSPRSACIQQGSCSISGYYSQSSCTAAGTCSLSGYTSQSSCTAAGTCSISSKTSQSTCTSSGTCSNSGETTQSSCTGIKACTIAFYTSQGQCTSHGGTWGYGTWTAGVWTAATWKQGVWTSATWTPNNHSTWNGCVMDRGFPMSPSNLSGNSGPDTTNNYDTNVVQPDVTKMASLYAAEQYGSCPQAVMGLSYNWSAMTTEVNNMSPAGNTNQAIGLELGWLSLVGGGPFTAPPLQAGYTYNQIIILLTDGLNTQDRWYSVQSQIDARQTLTCNNIKAAGITLYTVQVSTDGTPVSPLLQQCASDSTKFFYLTSSSQIVTTFNQIGTNLSNLYVAQ
jgi:Flp pilus assembly protein TadG